LLLSLVNRPEISGSKASSRDPAWLTMRMLTPKLENRWASFAAT
jgi:hypothetical protein